MAANIRRIENHTEVDRILNRNNVQGVLCNSFVEVGDDNFCLPSGYQEYEEKLNKFSVRDDDVFVTGHPKTGTTWVQEMTWLIVNNLDYVKAKEDIRKRVQLLEFPAIFDNNVVKKYFSGHDPLTVLETNPSPRCIKSHLHWSLLPEDIRNGTKQPKIIHVLRNPQDVCVSFYHYSKLIHSNTGTFEDYCKLFLAGRVICGPFWKLVLSYWQQRHRPNILFVKYKDMKEDLPSVIETVAKFLGKSLTGQEIEKLAQHLSFDSMKDNKAVNYHDLIKTIEQNSDVVSEGKAFMRRGEVGTYRLEMSSELIETFAAWSKENLEGTELNIENIE